MSLQGDLKAIPLADVMQMIASNLRSGTLYVASDEAARVLTFSRGRVTTGSSLEQRFLLGNVLCKRGAIDPLQLAKALEAQRNLGLPLGETLVRLGFLDPEMLAEVVQGQIQTVMNDVFRWRAGGFLFQEREDDPDEDEDAGFTVHGMLMEALRVSDDWARLAERFANRAAVPRFVEDEGGQSVEGASQDALALIEHIDGHRSIQSIIARTGWSDFRAIRALGQLHDAQLIHMRTGATGRSRRPQIQEVFTQHVPVMPRSGARALAMAIHEEPTEIELRDLALSDPGLAVSVLRTAGALAVGGAKVHTMSDAITTIGPDAARRAIVGGGLRGLYASGSQPWTEMWRHSLATAVAARLVARHIADRSDEIEAARLAALCHDIGCHLLRYHDEDAYEKVMLEASEGRPLVEAERRHLGIGHDVVGSQALGTWGASDAVRDAVLHHHAQATSAPQLAIVISLSNAMAMRHGMGVFPNRADEEMDASARALGIAKDELRPIERRFLQLCAAREPLW